MPIHPEVEKLQDEMTAWRHDIHARPETAFEEVETAAFVAERLNGFGLDEVHTGIAKTGVVGVIHGTGNAPDEGRAIGLRADMDALHIEELNDLPYRSQNPGKMHACGHDGHTTMLLGAAKHLARTRNFAGTVYVIFQPAEENEGGGRAMVEEGLFERFPMRSVFGMHNWPGLELGRMAVREGPMLAAFDLFEIIVSGKGAHAAMPHLGTDPIVAGAQLVQTLQTIVSRATDPLDSAVVSVTQFHGGDTWNVIPERASLRGTCRSFRPEVRDLIEERLRLTADAVSKAAGASAEVRYERRYPATINSAPETAEAAEAASEVVGEANLERNPSPTMGSEDFAFMLEAKAGCYILLGNGPGTGGCMLHNPHYDFNDAALVVGASYWVRLAERLLSKDARTGA
jgi:hippurate hydrolase